VKFLIYIIYSLLFLLLVLVTDCAIKPNTNLKKTRIIAVGFGETRETKEFKAAGKKPFAYVIWGNDVRDGAQCEITISNVTKAQRVYRRIFTHNTDTTGDRFNFERSKIIEDNKQWNRQIGNYYMDLYINGKRKSHYEFFIRP